MSLLELLIAAKNALSIIMLGQVDSMLGQVDDVVGVTDTGFEAQQLNVKTSEIGLQFGFSKCKSLTIGNQEHCIDTDLFEDS